MIQWKPIKTAPRDSTFVLLLCDSGYTTTPFRVVIGRWVPGYRNWWINYANDAVTDGGYGPTHWAEWNPPDIKNLRWETPK